MFYVSIVNFGDLLTKGHSGCWIQMTFKALSVNFAFATWSVGSSGIEPNYTIIFSFHFFIPFSVVNLGVLLMARYMSCKLPSKLAGSSNMNGHCTKILNTALHYCQGP